MNQPIHNAYWLSRFESILNSALAQHRAGDAANLLI